MSRSQLAVALALASLSLAPRLARADQCAWVDEAVGRHIHSVVATGSTVRRFCEPCGESEPGAPYQVETLHVEDVGDRDVDGQRHVRTLINGEEVDLAYLFVLKGGTRYDNVARLVGCPAEGVSRALPAEGSRGLSAVAQASPPAAPAAPIAPAHPLAFGEPLVRALIGACGAVFGMLLALAVVVAVMRREVDRAMTRLRLPRAQVVPRPSPPPRRPPAAT
jgi:hypothetical protein